MNKYNCEICGESRETECFYCIELSEMENECVGCVLDDILTVCADCYNEVKGKIKEMRKRQL